MGRALSGSHVGVLVLLLCVSSRASADPPDNLIAPSTDSGHPGQAPPRAERGHDPRGYEKQWFWGVGMSNYHVKLEESEALIDEQVNGIFGTLCLDWREPVTFKDWSDDWKIWDLWGMFGRDIGPRTSWFVSTGGAAAAISNGNLHFLLGLPVDIEADFTRVEAFLAGGIIYYPWGKPTHSQSKTRETSRTLSTLRGARPYVEIGTGYTYIHAHGDVRVSLPAGPRVYRKQDERDYHLAQITPRIGMDFPLTEKDSIEVSVCHHFFAPHGDEFDSNSISFSFRHRFKSWRMGKQRKTLGEHPRKCSG